MRAYLIPALLLTLLAVAGCPRPERETASFDADSLSIRIDDLRGEGRYTEAHAEAGHLLAELRARDDAAPWEIGDAQRLSVRLARAAALPDSSRRRLAHADSLSATLTGLFRGGEFARARDLLDGILVTRRELLGEPDGEVARTLHRLGAVLLQLGDYLAATARTREALDMNRAVLETDHPNIAKNLDNLAILRRRQGDFAGAEPLFREALAMSRRLHGTLDPGVARGTNNLAIFLSDKGDYADAEALCREALAMYRSLHGEQSVEVIRSLYNLSLMQTEQSHHDEAEATCLQALDMSRRVLGETHPQTAGLLHALGMTRYELRSYASADSLLDAAVAAYGATFGPEHAYVSWALLNRGAVLAAQGAYARADSVLSAASGIYERARAMAGTGYARSVFQPCPYPAHAAVLLELGRPGEAWRAAEHARSRALAELLMAQGEVPSNDADPLPRVLASLEPDTALLGWLHVALTPDEPLTWGYVIDRREGLRWIRLHPTLKDGEAKEVEAFRLALERAGSWPFPVDDTRRLDRRSRRLHDEWLAPLLAAADGAQNLVVVPSGPLLDVPLEALKDSTGTYLDDRYCVAYTPSATLHAWLHAQDRAAAPTAGALLLGDPAYSDPWLADLPGTRAEIENLAESLPDATVLLGDEASEARLAELNEAGALSRYRWIHLATHALIDDEDPTASALLLAQDSAEAGDDGRLTAREIVTAWHLNAELVCLSGCCTGLGRPTADEGYVGLTHAFLRAGAHSLLVSLWPVEDTATSLLMTRFYDNIAGRRDGIPIRPLDKAAALGEAKRWLRGMRGTDGTRPFRHPCYWSGFVLMGE